MQINDIIKKIKELPEDPDSIKIKSTAEELEMLNFSPILLIETPEILYMMKEDIINEINRVMNLDDGDLPDFDDQSFSDSDEFRIKHINLLYYYYELISRLRADIPEAWDYIHELYEDD